MDRETSLQSKIPLGASRKSLGFDDFIDTLVPTKVNEGAVYAATPTYGG